MLYSFYQISREVRLGKEEKVPTAMFLHAPPPQIPFSKERNMRLVIRRI